METRERARSLSLALLAVGLLTIGVVADAGAQMVVDVDIKPTSCPNPINPASRGVLPVAILGDETLDVNEIDVSSVQLEGVSPERSSVEDVAAPVGEIVEECDCTTDGPDGFDDLTLKFDTQAIIAALGEITNGDVVTLTLTGTLLDGTPFQGLDCVIVRARGNTHPQTAGSRDRIWGTKSPRQTRRPF
jgi:hypothetical protein